MRKLYLLMIEFWWKVEHQKLERIACLGFRKRKYWERRYVNKFNENIYGKKL